MSDLEKLEKNIAMLPKEAQQMISELVAFLKQRYRSDSLEQPQSINLENEPFIGMWSDRVDMESSSAWVKEVRQKHWRN